MSAVKPSFYESVKTAIFTTIVPIGSETLRLLPDSLVLGTALLTMISLCMSYGVLLLTMIELMLTQRIFASIIGSIRPTGLGPNSLHEICQPGFAFPNMMRISISSICYHRDCFPPECFSFRNYGNMKVIQLDAAENE